MTKSYRSWTPGQSYLLPPSPAEWLPENHLAYFVLETIDELDLGAIERVLQSKDARGERSYPPRLMIALLIYAYSTGVFSSRKIARATYEDVAFRVIAGEEHPHFTTVNQFRLDHRAALAQLFHQVLRLCQSVGLVKLGHVAIDGSKVKANASKHKAMSYERMQKADARLTHEIDDLLRRADETDAAEDALYGIGEDKQDLPAELQRREGRRAAIRAAAKALRAETAAARADELRTRADAHRETTADLELPQKQRRAAATLATKCDQQALALDGNDDDDDEGPPPSDTTDLPRNQPPTKPDGTPAPNAQRNFTDPDSRIMVRDGGHYVQAYNVQIAADDASQIIVAEAVTNQAPDVEHFVPMLRRVVTNCDAVPERVTADAGYFSDANIRAAEHFGSEPFIPVDRQRRDEPDGPPKLRSTPMRAVMRAVLATPHGKRAYARRKGTVEPVYGQIFAARGFRQFLLRGLHKVRFEWSFLSLTHNLLKLFRHKQRSQLAAAVA